MKPVTINYRGRKQTYMYDIEEAFDIYVKYKNSGDLCKGHVEYDSGSQDFTFAWQEHYAPDDWSNEDGTPIPYSYHISEVLELFLNHH